jgi:hypothetical protein
MLERIIPTRRVLKSCRMVGALNGVKNRNVFIVGLLFCGIVEIIVVIDVM